MLFHNLLAIIDLVRSALSVVPLSIVSGGVIFPLLFRPLAEGARRTADLYIIPLEHSAPWIGQEHLDGSSWVAGAESSKPRKVSKNRGFPSFSPRPPGRGFAGPQVPPPGSKLTFPGP